MTAFRMPRVGTSRASTGRAHPTSSGPVAASLRPSSAKLPLQCRYGPCRAFWSFWRLRQDLSVVAQRLRNEVRAPRRYAGCRRERVRRAWWLLLAVASSPREIRAQVNVEPLRQQVAEEGFGARLRASAASYAGNTRGVIFGSSGLVGVDGSRNFAFINLSGDYAKLNGVVSVAKWFGHVRHDYQLNGYLWWEEYAQIESDRFRRVALRQLIGTGPRFGLFQRDYLRVFYGASYMYEHTNLDTSASGGRGEGDAHRFGNYLSATLRAHDRIVLSSVTYVQPRIDAPTNFKLLSVNGAEFVVTKRLRSRIDATYRYDSVTPPDVRRSDLELKSALELAF